MAIDGATPRSSKLALPRLVQRLACTLQRKALLDLLEEEGQSLTSVILPLDSWGMPVKGGATIAQEKVAVDCCAKPTDQGALGTPSPKCRCREAAALKKESPVTRCEMGHFAQSLGVASCQLCVTVQRDRERFQVRAANPLVEKPECLKVRKEIEEFLADTDRREITLSSGYSGRQRSYAHALAEHHGLAHCTLWGASGTTSVHLSKEKRACRPFSPSVLKSDPGPALKERCLIRTVTDAALSCSALL